MRPSQQNHRINMVSVHMGEDAGREFGQRVRSSKLVVFCRDPSHHAKATDIVKIDRLKAKEAEVGEVDPVAAVIMTCKILFSNGNYIVFYDRLGMADQCRSGSPKRIAIGSCLPYEETASRIGLQILSMHGHIANEENGTACRIEREGHQGAKGEPRMLARKRRQGSNRC